MAKDTPKRRAGGADPTIQLAPMTTLYRPVDAAELAQVVEAGYRRFPRADPFEALREEAPARALAARAGDGADWVTRFAIQSDFIARYPAVDGTHRIPQADLGQFNDAIVGLITVLRSPKPSDPPKR